MAISLMTIGLLSLLLPVSWKATPGTTYSLQQSGNLSDWESLPVVIQGTGNDEHLLLDLPISPAFARLRFSDDGDTNENGLPDIWEWSEFGLLDVDPFADPDMDGLNNMEEWTARTDPNDFFNGETPVLRLTCGKEWLVTPGEVSIQAVSLYLEHASGDPWPGAPVVLRLEEDSTGGLCMADGAVARILVPITDSLGRIHQSVEAIHYLAPPGGDVSEILEISAGSAKSALLLRTTQSVMGGPPRNFTHSILIDGSSRFEWSGDAAAADSFIIETQSEQGDWITLVEMDTGDLPYPDPDTNRYCLILP